MRRFGLSTDMSSFGKIGRLNAPSTAATEYSGFPAHGGADLPGYAGNAENV